MPEEFGTRDVLEQVDTRLSNVEQDLRAIRSETNALRGEVGNRFERIEERMNTRFEQLTRWMVSLILLSWLSIMASIWLKP